MKRLMIVALILTLALVSSVWAMPTFGVKLGANLANFTVDNKNPGTSYNMRTGVMVGGSVEGACRKVENLAFRGELLYVMKGSEAESGGNKATFMVDEIVVAPFVVYKFPQPKFTPFAELGPELGFNVQHKLKNSSSTADLDKWASTDFGVNVGLGCGMPVATGEGTIDLRYNLGLTNMNKIEGSTIKYKNNGIQLVLGYNFNVPTK